MNDSCWLIMNARGIRRMAKGRRSSWRQVERPALEKGEYAVLVSVTVPNTAFKPQALPEATLEIQESQLVAPTVRVAIEEPPPPPE